MHYFRFGCFSYNIKVGDQKLAFVLNTYYLEPFKDEAQTALFKDPVRTAL